MRRVISAAVGGIPLCEMKPEIGCCAMSDLWPSLVFVLNGNPFLGSNTLVVAEPAEGESMLTSSLIPDDEPLGRKAGGGGVTLVPLILLVSENVSQKFFPFEFINACFLKLLDRFESVIISSSIMSSSPSRVVFRFGEVDAVDIFGMSKGGGGAATPTVVAPVPAPAPAVIDGGARGSRFKSLSRTWRMTSASRWTSESTGILSSARAARMRAKPLVFGYIGR